MVVHIQVVSIGELCLRAQDLVWFQQKIGIELFAIVCNYRIRNGTGKISMVCKCFGDVERRDT